MQLERSIAFRYLVSKRQVEMVTLVSLISITGITIGVAALIIVLSVFNGFNGLVMSILVSFDPHLRIESQTPVETSSYEAILASLRRDEEVEGAAPFVTGKALVVSRTINRVINVKGIDDSLIDAVSGLRSKMVLGKLSLRKENRLGIIIGFTLADRLGAVVGDTVSLVSPAGSELALLQLGQPIVRRFTVVGIYESNNKEYDAQYAYIGLEAAQLLFGMGTTINGIEVRLKDLEKATEIQRTLAARFGPLNRYLTWYDLHRELYSVMEIERWMAYVILCLIIGVASFNLLGSLTMSVIEKTRDIGILKTMGATSQMIQRIFITQGVAVGILGAVTGLILGVAVVILQQEYHLVTLDTTVYIIPALPVELRLIDLVIVPLTAIVLASVAAIYPARRAASLIPVEAIRWE